MNPINEMDYLYASGRIRFLEGQLLNRERAHRMIEARTTEDAFHVLAECGYDTPVRVRSDDLAGLLNRERCRLFDTISEIIPHPQIVRVFRIRYDIHNVKVLLKTAGHQTAPPSLLLDCGIFSTEHLRVMLKDMELRELPPLLGHAILEARDMLARTGDPQLTDILLDKACLGLMLDMARQSGSSFLTGYVRLIIDAANLRTLIRMKRMGKSPALLHQTLSVGGMIAVKPILSASTLPALESLFAASLLKSAAQSAAAALSENRSATELDRQCDNALTAYLQPARMLAFGHELAVAYLAAKESEITSIRSILSGRMAGLPSETIRERIRDHYV